MTTVHESITISATREQIRPIFFDPKRMRARETAIYHYQPDEEWPAVGATYEVGFKTFLMNVDAVSTCLAYDPETMRLEFEQHADGQEPAHWLYTFDEQDGKTTVSLKSRFHWRGVQWGGRHRLHGMGGDAGVPGCPALPRGAHPR